MHSFSEWLKRYRKALGALAAVLVVAGTAWLYAGAAGGGEGGPQAEPDSGAVAERRQDGAGEAQRQPDAEGGEAATAPSPSGGSEPPSATPAPSAGGSGGPPPSAESAPPSATPAAGGSGGESAPPVPAGSASPPKPTASPAAKPPAAGAAPSAAPSKTAPPASGAKPGGGSAAASPTAKPPRADTVSLSVTGPEETGAILSGKTVVIEKGDTVLDALQKATRAAKVQMEHSGSGAGAYVSGIGNVYEFDEGPGSGWLYSVNGEFSSKSAGAVKVEPGDVIEWRYTLDYGDDLGAPSASQGGG
ncbi:DUF4430 domain-containing protein [Paenibacillus albicereus]|uniref:DUF4430 domain-containing protein n=1 Tax=Paenibacillus albicereus TaxID=2726185 RepID=A0A6H2H1S6_9BACL|nr:DUF4430 domain-containing protein [Paenibacillus albicereus]QJC53612.1 DUF4430 domain-containing protein [Paenibacillus albicereus]